MEQLTPSSNVTQSCVGANALFIKQRGTENNEIQTVTTASLNSPQLSVRCFDLSAPVGFLDTTEAAD